MQEFLQFLHNLFIAHISEHFFNIFLKLFSELFQILSDFNTFSTHLQFLKS